MTPTWANKDHWSERGRATSLANSDALDRPRRSVGRYAGRASSACLYE
jgi:hypothetical protein